MLVCAFLKGQYAEENCDCVYLWDSLRVKMCQADKHGAGRVSYRLGDVLRRPDLPEFQVTWILGHGLAQLQQTQTGG